LSDTLLFQLLLKFPIKRSSLDISVFWDAKGFHHFLVFMLFGLRQLMGFMGMQALGIFGFDGVQFGSKFLSQFTNFSFDCVFILSVVFQNQSQFQTFHLNLSFTIVKQNLLVWLLNGWTLRLEIIK
jgi:hypothetical protein